MEDTTKAGAVDVLILGAGWLSTFLIPLCRDEGVSYAATSRTGRDGTIKFGFDPDSGDAAPFAALPTAQTALISFPIVAKGASARLVGLYRSTHGGEGCTTAFVQLGSTRIWGGAGGTGAKSFATTTCCSYDRHSPLDVLDDRARAETELLGLSPGVRTTVLDLAGLWGGERHPRRWAARVAPTKVALRGKGSLHLVHGLDVARAVLAVHVRSGRAVGERWLVTDGAVYDWWDLMVGWGGEAAVWVRELMEEKGVVSLPREPGTLGRVLDSTEFWEAFGIIPVMGRPE